ncbi:MAG: lipopolysaccharide heptosyltransferase II [Methylophaga sp.]|uniref:lipopolysaccharide heptosyltransferase II n=1 Tax=Methylophaga sp. UBA678 TaxID=1946901 RepID=UPI000C671C3A|nr:lipopolysaccharide heptosyltransferase II [Methylophaga sp. UBA678]MAX52966.1 lipopolysaccharide heptosyltransferase II [Methylophaga sp.]|tara:strand:- start:46487 stop:47518 length:1032 start_codon:yes stop_codon:yes gene_type:complete
MTGRNPDKKILIVGPSWVGDMVMAQSLFIALKKNNPEVTIDVLAMDWTRPLLQRMPEVNEAISMPISHGIFGWNMRKKLGQSLRDKRYDQAIVLPNSWKSALIPWFAKIPLRTGWLGEYRYGLLNDARKLDKQALPMMVERFVALAHPASLSRIPPAYEAPLMLAEPANEAINPKRQSDGQKRLILCPGAEFGPAKQWPTSHYAALADFFLTSGWQVLILGSKADVSTAEEIIHLSSQQSNNLISLAGQTKLEEAIDLLGTADQVVSNDSGLMHIAAALQVPLVVVYGPTSPAFTPPLASNAHITQIDIECSPCFKRTCPLGHHNCMKKLSVDSVIELIKTTL